MEALFKREEREFMTGNEVVVWAALAAGAHMLYGYPITPQNEIMHHWSRLSAKYGRHFLQTEDELAAGFAAIGGVMGGLKAFSATSGPGTVLFQEPLSMAEMMRLPLVLVVQQRGGPSTATVIYSQQEVTLSTYGGNGEGWRVVYSTSGHQDLFDYTIKAFDTAWRYSFPVIVLGDGYQAKMREPVTLYDPEGRGIHQEASRAFLGNPGMPGRDRPPAHLRNAYSVEEELAEALVPIISDYEEMSPMIEEYREERVEGAEILLLAHGIAARTAAAALPVLQREGIRAGLFRPVTLRPFPARALRERVSRLPRMLVIESSQGQLYRLAMAELAGLSCTVHTLFKPGVGITVEDILARAVEIRERSG